VDTLFIEPGSPWENGYVESFNGKFRDELLSGEIFYTLQESDHGELQPASRENGDQAERAATPSISTSRSSLQRVVWVYSSWQSRVNLVATA
jgi:transposase InsO family protein